MNQENKKLAPMLQLGAASLRLSLLHGRPRGGFHGRPRGGFLNKMLIELELRHPPKSHIFRAGVPEGIWWTPRELDEKYCLNEEI